MKQCTIIQIYDDYDVCDCLVDLMQLSLASIMSDLF